jgi:RNA polymerase sigma factor (sigma-70 family)
MEDDEKYRVRRLFRQLSKGDENALRFIYHSLKPIIDQYLLRFDNLDSYLSNAIKSELLEKIWDKRGHFAHEDTPIALMLGMVHKIALYRLRQKHDHTVSIINAHHKRSDLGADDILLSKEYQELLEKAIAQLPPGEKKIFKPKYEQGYSNDEIAAMLHLSKQTIKNEASRATMKIKQLLGLISLITIIEIVNSL